MTRFVRVVTAAEIPSDRGRLGVRRRQGHRAVQGRRRGLRARRFLPARGIVAGRGQARRRVRPVPRARPALRRQDGPDARRRRLLRENVFRCGSSTAKSPSASTARIPPYPAAMSPPAPDLRARSLQARSHRLGEDVMFRHLLVPIDDSALSTETVRQAVMFASTLGAKITFFHAKADYGASSIGALERVMSPSAFNEQMAGEARALLAKAETVARAANVAYASIWRHERPAVRGDPRRRRTQRLRSHLHGVARRARPEEPDPRLADAARAPAHHHSGARRVGRRQCAGAAPCGTARDHPRGAPLARRGDPRARIPGPRDPRARRRAAVCAAARDPPLHQGIPRGAAPPEGGCVPVPQAAPAHVRVQRHARRARAAARRGLEARRRDGRRRSTATRRIRRAASTASPTRSSATPRTNGRT